MGWFKRLVGWALSGLAWLISPTQAVALVIGIASTIAAAFLKVPFWAWPFVLFATFGVSAWAIRQGLALWDHLSERKRSIPIAISGLADHGLVFRTFSDASGLPDAVSYRLGEVTISNLSASKSVALELYLHLTGSGWDYKMPCSPCDMFGRDMRTKGAAEILLAQGLPVPNYLENPLQIAPGATIVGAAVFLHTFLSEDDHLTWAKAFTGGDPPTRGVVVYDHFSGVELNLGLPVKYRGRAN